MFATFAQYVPEVESDIWFTATQQKLGNNRNRELL